MNQNLRELIWNSMLSADMNVRYFGHIATSYQKWDRLAKIIIAATSSTAVSGWAVWGEPGIEWIWKLLSAISALFAIALPVFDPAKLLRNASTLKGAWYSLMRDYELLWAKSKSLSDDEANKRYDTLICEEKKLSELESSIGRRRKLVSKCQDEVCNARGLPTTPQGD